MTKKVEPNNQGDRQILSKAELHTSYIGECVSTDRAADTLVLIPPDQQQTRHSVNLKSNGKEGAVSMASPE